jgi:5-formyltetrahydrofolate cyclo-ligase
MDEIKDQAKDFTSAKALWRQRLRPLRLDRSSHCQAAILAVARRELRGLLPPGRRLGLYWPLAGEIDLRSLVELAGERPDTALAHRLALPAVAGVPGEGQLEYRAWQPGELLEPDLCRIPAPGGPALAPGALGLLLVPALGFDRQGIRLGSGGGWYDRLRADPAWRALPSLAVLPAACLVEQLPRDPWDVPFDGWLDEAGVHRLPAAGSFRWTAGKST